MIQENLPIRKEKYSNYKKEEYSNYKKENIPIAIAHSKYVKKKFQLEKRKNILIRESKVFQLKKGKY